MEDEGHDLKHKCADDMAKTFEEVDKVLAIASEVIHASKPPQVPVVMPQAPAATAAGPIEADVALKIPVSIKPEKLRGTDTPQCFLSWKKKVKSYFETGRLGRLSLDVQHAVIRALIDVELEEVIGDRLDPAMLMFAPEEDENAECVMSLLQDYIMLKHPLFIRRRAFLTVIR